MPPSIHLAINANCAEMVKLIFETDQDSIYARDQEGWSTLHMAAEVGNLEIVSILVSKLDPNYKC